MSFMKTKNATIAFDIWESDEGSESAPWISLINGHTRSRHDFRLIAKHLVNAGFRVVSLDNRGSGQSISESDFSLQDMAEDWVQLWDEIGVGTTHLAGISMGGLIARILASVASERIESLSLISTMPGPEYLSFPRSSGWPETQEGVSEILKTYFAKDYFKKNQILIQAMAKTISKAVKEEYFNEKAAGQREAVRHFKPEQFPVDQFRARTQVIYGDEDQIISGQTANDLVSLFKGADKIEFKGAGHLLLGEKPRELLDVLVTFCK